MTTRSLALGISSLLGLLSLASAMVTVVPSLEFVRLIVLVSFAVGFLTFGVLGFVVGSLSSQHWLNRSLLVKGVLLAILGACSYLLASII